MLNRHALVAAESIIHFMDDYMLKFVTAANTVLHEQNAAHDLATQDRSEDHWWGIEQPMDRAMTFFHSFDELVEHYIVTGLGQSIRMVGRWN
ncbi:hypothetical protein OIV83_005281 [Microbotryomycetes sp. JL201]|nr:hypothetical protein OIV83_005281 [Microbotryomycetes sp. JL201]